MTDQAIRAPLGRNGESRTYTVKAWHVEVGDLVQEGDPVCDLVFEGEVVTVGSPATGRIHNINRIAGQQVDAAHSIGSIVSTANKRTDAVNGVADLQGGRHTLFQSTEHSLSDEFSSVLVTIYAMLWLFVTAILTFLSYKYINNSVDGLWPLSAYVFFFSTYVFIVLPVMWVSVVHPEMSEVFSERMDKIQTGLFLTSHLVVAFFFWVEHKDWYLNKSFYTFATGGRVLESTDDLANGFEFSVGSCKGSVNFTGESYEFFLRRVLWNTAELSGVDWGVQRWGVECLGVCFIKRDGNVKYREFDHFSIRIESSELEAGFLSATQNIRAHCENENLAAAARLRGAD